MKHCRILFSILLLALFVTNCAPITQQTKTPAPSGPSTLAERLPENVSIYLQFDFGAIMRAGLHGLTFADAELGEAMRNQLSQTWNAAKKVLAQKFFSSRLLDRVPDSVLHVVIFDDSGEKKPEPSLAIFIETDAALSQEFMNQSKTLLKQTPEKLPGPFQVLESATGELSLASEKFHFGQIGSALVFAPGAIEPLRQMMQKPPTKSLAATRRYVQAEQAGALIKSAIDLRPFLPKSGADAQTSTPANFDVQKLFSVDRMRAVSMSASYGDTEQSAQVSAAVGLQVEAPISKVLHNLFDGGRSFQLPAVNLDFESALFYRFGLAELYTEIVGRLPAAAQQQVQMSTAAAQQMLGQSVDAILGLFSGDFYFFLNVDGAGLKSLFRAASQGESVEMPDLEAMVFAGIADSVQVEQVLAKLYKVGSNFPAAAAMLSQTQLQGKTMYIIQAPQAPAIALLLLDHHLVAGKLQSVKNLFTPAGAKQESSASWFHRAVEKHAPANFLCLLSHQMILKLQGAQTDKQEQGMNEMIGALQALAKGDESYNELITGLGQILPLGKKLQARVDELTHSEVIVAGQYQQDSYTLSLSGLTKKK